MQYAHLHFHCCIIDGVFAPAAAADAAAGVVFHEAAGLDATAVATVQARVRQRVLRACIRRGLLAPRGGDEMGGWDHGGGFALDASARIAGADRAGRERLLRYCARPPFALDHLHQHDAEHLVYHIAVVEQQIGVQVVGLAGQDRRFATANSTVMRSR